MKEVAYEDTEVNESMEQLTLLVRNKHLTIALLQEFVEANEHQLDFNDDYNDPVGIAVVSSVREDLLELLMQ